MAFDSQSITKQPTQLIHMVLDERARFGCLADSAGVKFGNAYDAGAERKFQAMR